MSDPTDYISAEPPGKVLYKGVPYCNMTRYELLECLHDLAGTDALRALVRAALLEWVYRGSMTSEVSQCIRNLNIVSAVFEKELESELGDEKA